MKARRKPREMLEEIRFRGQNRQEIIVQTRKRRNLTNFVAPPVTCDQDGLYQLYRKTYGRAWIPRKPATGVYNCAGMVWANRRAALPEPSEWQAVLDDDEYRLLENDEDPSIGDIAVY